MNSLDYKAEARERLSGKWGFAIVLNIISSLFIFIIQFLLSKLLINWLFNLILKDYTNIILINLFKYIYKFVIFVISVPVQYGLIQCYINLYNDEPVNIFDFILYGFSNFWYAIFLQLRIMFDFLMPTILLILSGILIYILPISFKIVYVFVILAYYIYMIIKLYNYRLSYFIFIDNEELLLPKKAITKSILLMNNNRFKLFCLDLSFIGWMLLSIISYLVFSYSYNNSILNSEFPFWSIPFFILGTAIILFLIPYIMFSNISFYYSLKENNSKNDVPPDEYFDNLQKTIQNS